jgi:hypothetical protein
LSLFNEGLAETLFQHAIPIRLLATLDEIQYSKLLDGNGEFKPLASFPAAADAKEETKESR